MTYAPFIPTKRVQLTSVGLKKKKEKTKTVKEIIKHRLLHMIQMNLKILQKKKGTEKRATKNVQLVMQHCCKVS